MNTKNFFALTKKDISWEVIERKLNGDASEEQVAQFEAWYAHSPKHRAYYAAAERSRRRHPDAEASFAGMEDHLWRGFMRHIRFRRTTRILRIASGSFAAASVAAFALLFSIPSGNGTIFSAPATPTIAAGTTQAILVTSSGKTIDLGAQKGKMIEASAELTNDGTTLNYDSSQAPAPPQQEYHTITTPVGGEYAVRLADGTAVFLGPHSSLKLPIPFGSGKRIVEMSGEVFFDVASDARHPFVVKAGDMELEVIGTSFNVREYADEPNIEATLVSGKVCVSAAGHRRCELHPGQQAVVSKSAQAIEVRDVMVARFTQWKNGKLVIRDERLEDIFMRLSKWYGFNVHYIHDEARNLRFYADADRYANLNDLLDTFEKTGKVKFEICGTTVRVKLNQPAALHLAPGTSDSLGAN